MPIKKLSSGALAGALAGLLYALAEYAIVILEPMLRWGPRSLGPEHWFWELLFGSIYVLAGAAIGAAAACLRGIDPAHSAPRAVMAVGLVVLIAGRLLDGETGFQDLVFAAALGGMAAIAWSGIFARKSATWLAWMSSPWVGIPLVFAWIKFTDRADGLPSCAAAILGVWTVVAGMVLAASRSTLAKRTLEHRFLPLTASASALLLLVLPAASYFLGAPPPISLKKSAGAGQNRPNLLLIVMDTVRADHLSAYGYSRRTTPNLEAFAREAVVYNNAVAPADMTLSSYGSIYTGLYPSWHHAVPSQAGYVMNALDSSFHTLAEILSANGYATLAVLANCGYLSRDFGMQQGFRYYDVRPPVQQGGAEYYLRDAVRPALSLLLPTGELDRVYRRADQITDDGLRLVSALREGGRPFFLSLNYMSAHEPYLAPTEYRAPFDSPEFDPDLLRDVRSNLAAHRRTPDTVEGLRDLTAEYDSALAYMDSEIKRLLDGMRRAGLYDNTMIVITSDHGEALGERDDLNHPASVHEELVRIPLLIKYPRSAGIPAPQRSDVTASSVDLLPTFLDAAGLPCPGNLHGSVLRTLRADDQRIVISESIADAHRMRMAGRPSRVQKALYWGTWKLIWKRTGSEMGSGALYNWRTDSAELHNLYVDEHAVAARLTMEIQQWLQSAPKAGRSTRTMDRQTLDQLRGLGYVQ